MEGNREYKSDVFSMLMEDKRYALQVYNVLNGTEFTDPELVEIRVLEKGVSMTVRNDAAILVDASLNLYEHQSTVCPNMPLRQLNYLALTLWEMIKGEDIFGSNLIKIPVPKFAVFYNGGRNMPKEQILKLSDAFERKTDTPQIELICTVYNINAGKNEELLQNCQVLKEYMTFVNYVREYKKVYDSDNLAPAVEAAIDRCIKENILADFMRSRREEITKYMELDYTFERQIELARKSSMQEGLEQGLQQGMQEGLEQGLQQGMQLGIKCARRVQEGADEATLLEEGFSKEMIELAMQSLSVNS